MTMLFIYPIGGSAVSLLGLSPRQRLQRQVQRLRDATWIERLEDLTAGARLLIIRTDYVTGHRTLKQLARCTGIVLRCPDAARRYARAYRTFSSTRGAYGRF